MKFFKFLLSYLSLIFLAGVVLYIPFNLVTGELNIYIWDSGYKISWLIMLLLSMVYLLPYVFEYHYDVKLKSKHNDIVDNDSENQMIKS